MYSFPSVARRQDGDPFVGLHFAHLPYTLVPIHCDPVAIHFILWSRRPPVTRMSRQWQICNLRANTMTHRRSAQTVLYFTSWLLLRIALSPFLFRASGISQTSWLSYFKGCFRKANLVLIFERPTLHLCYSN